MRLFHDYEMNLDEDEVIENWEEAEVNDDDENELVEEIEWIEEFEDKKLDDIFDYLEAKRKILNGDITEMYISVNSYNPDHYDFKWR